MKDVLENFTTRKKSLSYNPRIVTMSFNVSNIDLFISTVWDVSYLEHNMKSYSEKKKKLRLPLFDAVFFQMGIFPSVRQSAGRHYSLYFISLLPLACPISSSLSFSLLPLHYPISTLSPSFFFSLSLSDTLFLLTIIILSLSFSF